MSWIRLQSWPVPPPSDDEMVSAVLEMAERVEHATGRRQNCVDIPEKGLLPPSARRKVEALGFWVREGPEEIGRS